MAIIIDGLKPIFVKVKLVSSRGMFTELESNVSRMYCFGMNSL